MLRVELFEASGETLASRDFGTVLPGTSTPIHPFVLRNTGDADLDAPLAWVEQAATEDGEFRVAIAGVAVTGTSRETATVLPALAVGAEHAGEAAWLNPAGGSGVPVDTATLRVEPV